MRTNDAMQHICRWGLVAAAIAGAGPAFADVTVTSDTTMDLLITKMHTTSTERTSGDKQRRDNDGKLDGPLAFLAGNMRSADIVRLDKSVEWHLDPDKKRYRESEFATPEQRAAAQQKMQAMLDKMKQCPAATQQPGPAADCEKTDPKFDVKKTDESAVIAGFTARKTRMSMTYSCKSVKTGDTCDFTVASDMWLTTDEVPGAEERRSFATAYARKLGIDEVTGPMAGQMKTMLAPYLDQLKQVAAKAGEIKGTPLRTVFTVSIGGAQCQSMKQAQAGGGGAAGGSAVADAGGAARDAATQSATSSAQDASRTALEKSVSDSVAGRALGSAASAFGSKLVGGLFAKKSDPKQPAGSAAADASSSAAPTSVAVLNLTNEVRSISTNAIGADQFDIPAGWQKETPKASRDKEEAFECPKSGP